jgi:hypothetical protein
MRVPIQAAPVARYGSARNRRLEGIAPQSLMNCSTCVNDLAKAIQWSASNVGFLGCVGIAAVFGTACDAAFGGPEDPVGDVVCPIVAISIKTACNKYGISWLKNYSNAVTVADGACQTAKNESLCSGPL